MAESQPPRLQSNRSQSNRALPARPSIEWLKKTAKERLDSLRGDDPAATLAMAQLVVAREYGFTNWRALQGHIKAIRPEPIPADAEELKKRFRNAVTHHRLEEIRQCLQSDPSLANAPIFAFGQRAIGATHGHVGTIDLLISFRADINLKSDWWAGPWGVLDMADEATAEVLIERGATIDIFAATHLNRLDRMRELLAADPSLVRAKGGDGGRPLHFAKSVEAIDLLLSHGAEIDARDVDHESTAAQWAMPRPSQEFPLPRDQANGVNVMRWLLERGASPDVFMLAAVGDVERMRKLIDSDPTVLDVRVGEKDYSPCPKAPGEHIYFYKLAAGRTAFEVAKTFRNQACLDLLLSRSSPKQRYLAACAMGDEVSARKTLREHPKLMQLLTPQDHNNLSNAAWIGDGNAVRLMLDLGFNPLAAPAQSGTALHCAAWHGRAAIVRVILEHPSVRSRLSEIIEAQEQMYHSTPFGWCCHGSTNCRNPSGDYPEVAKLLLDAGAKVGPNFGDASQEVRAVIEAKRKTG